MIPLLSISGLSIEVDGKIIVRDFSLEIGEGEVHAIMGPNGSGKSTLVNTLMGHPSYSVTGGTVMFKGKDLLSIKPNERAQAGLFLAPQSSREIAGVPLKNFLFTAYNAQARVRDMKPKLKSPIRFQEFLQEKMKTLGMDASFAERSLNQGLSGGEKKKAEILQLITLQPLLALLDETDSGLDIDALKVVSEGINSMRSDSFSALLVTHYIRILDYVKPDHVHVMIKGQIQKSGGPELALKLEKDGYEQFDVA